MFESQLIFNMKKLKQRLGELAIQKRQQIEGAKRAKQAEADFTSEGPHEVEL